MKKLLLVSSVLPLLFLSLITRGAVVYNQPHNGSGSVYQSSVNGTDYDQLTWDMFRVDAATAITEVRWRGGYVYGATYSGHVTNWTIAFYRDLANGFEPDIISPPFAVYTVTGNAAETLAGVFSGTTLYDYAFTLPNPFQAMAGSNYWLLIQANQAGIPEWAMASGSGGIGGLFRRVAGMADWYFYRTGGDLAFSLLASDGPTATITCSSSPALYGEILGAGAYPVGSVAALTARPAAGFGFVNWTESGVQVSSASTYQFPVTVSRALVANFTPRYIITASASPNYGGTVTGGGTYNSNAPVTLIATAASGYAFVNWTWFGTPVSLDASYSFDAVDNRTLVANFEPSLSTAVFDFDSGMPPVTPHQGMPGSQWNNGVTAFFSTLSGAWSIQNTFYGWVPGVFSGNFLYPSTWGSTLAIQFDQPITNIDIAFATGDVSSEYDIPTTVRIRAYTNSAAITPVATATAKGNWITGAYPEGSMSLGSGTPFTKVTIDMPTGQNPPVSYILFVDNIVVHAVPKPPVNIIAGTAPVGGGTVAGDGLAANGSIVSLTAIPNSGYAFDSWTESGVPVCFTEIYTFTATVDRTLVANFVQLPPTFVVITAASPSNAGVTSGDGAYLNGSTADLSAAHNTGYYFVNWTENSLPVCDTESYSFTVSADRLLVANFALIVIPTLEIQSAANAIVLSWPTNSTGFTLQQSPALASPGWTNSDAAVTIIGTKHQATIPTTNNAFFFRLTHP